MHVSAFLKHRSGGGLVTAHQSLPHVLQPAVSLNWVHDCVCVNDPRGTPTSRCGACIPPYMFAMSRVWPSLRGLH